MPLPPAKENVVIDTGPILHRIKAEYAKAKRSLKNKLRASVQAPKKRINKAMQPLLAMVTELVKGRGLYASNIQAIESTSYSAVITAALVSSAKANAEGKTLVDWVEENDDKLVGKLKVTELDIVRIISEAASGNMVSRLLLDKPGSGQNVSCLVEGVHVEESPLPDIESDDPRRCLEIPIIAVDDDGLFDIGCTWPEMANNFEAVFIELLLDRIKFSVASPLDRTHAMLKILADYLEMAVCSMKPYPYGDDSSENGSSDAVAVVEDEVTRAKRSFARGILYLMALLSGYGNMPSSSLFMLFNSESILPRPETLRTTSGIG